MSNPEIKFRWVEVQPWDAKEGVVTVSGSVGTKSGHSEGDFALEVKVGNGKWTKVKNYE